VNKRPLSIGYVVGDLGRGGAELQTLQLARGLVARGHRVSVMAYDGPAVLDEAFIESGVLLQTPACTTRTGKVRAVSEWLGRAAPDVVHGIMQRPSSVTLLARGWKRRPAVIASDYSSAAYGRSRGTVAVALTLFAGADAVVTEIELNRVHMERMAPWLRGKIAVIRNGVDTDRFHPPADAPPAEIFRFISVGTLSSVKNPLRVVEAVAELVSRGHTSFRLDWYGRDAAFERVPVGEQARARARDLGVEGHIIFHGDRPQIDAALRRAHALVHVSLREGFPNAVAEGLASGLPVVVSTISDLPLVVKEACNGFVCQETSVRSIADAMEQMLQVPEPERQAMGRRSRELALKWFHVERFLDNFEALYQHVSVPSARGLRHRRHGIATRRRGG
jgi:glycosyltransferase involved in cell wall biosynthesis